MAIDKHQGTKMLVRSRKSLSSLQTSGSFIWLETSDGVLEEVEQQVAMISPFICQEVLENGKGSSRNSAIVLPPQVHSNVLKLILEYCRFHHLPGRSNKECKLFDDKFVRLSTRRLCELTSAADSLHMKALVDLTSRALARLIEGKSAEEIRETFNLPDDLTEEEKLEPLKNTADDPRIRLLNRLYAKKRKVLLDGEKTKTPDQEEGLQDERPLEELLSFINGGKEGSKQKSKKKRNKKKKEPAKDVAAETSSDSKTCDDFDVTRTCLSSDLELQKPGPCLFDEHFDSEFDEDDDLDPSMREALDREVEEFARRLNTDWDERRRMQDYLAMNAQEQRQLGHLSLRIASISLVNPWCGGKGIDY